jgi:GNAT superfamily N-acetyltransferase
MRDPLGSEPPGGDEPVPTMGGSEPTDSPRRPGQVSYRAMTEADLPFVVDQHLYHFPDGFFARLGPRFLSEYYRAFLTGSAVRATIAEVDDEPAGYLVGVTDPPVHRDHVVRRHGRALVLKAVVAMLRRPALALLFLRTRTGLYARKLLRRHPPSARAASTAGGAADTTAGPEPRGGATAVLTHVAVVPGAQSCGIGSELIRRFDEEVATAGCEWLTLVTASGEDGAGPYYRRHGWQPSGDRRTPDGLHLTTYERPVQAAPHSRYHTRGSEDTA